MIDPPLKKPRLFITGGSGLLALNWAFYMRDTWDIVLGLHQHGVSLKGVETCQPSWLNPIALANQIAQLSPDLIVHAAGLTNVDRCETDPKLAYQGNVEISKNIATAAAKIGAPLIHISTDHLFSGLSSFCTEEDAVQPLNEYARSKLIAELAVKEVGAEALILRTNFFGWGHTYRQSFSDWIVLNLRAGKPLKLFDDVFITPILLDSLIQTAHELIDKKISGTINLVGDERLSKYDFAIRIAKQFDLPVQLIKRNTMDSAHLLAKRPLDMSLSNTKVQAILGRSMGGVDEFLPMLYTQEKLGRHKEFLRAVKSDHHQLSSL